jgi:hypothetical protein
VISSNCLLVTPADKRKAVFKIIDLTIEKEEIKQNVEQNANWFI